MPRLDALGITRLGDLTGLDRIGISVVQAVRPLALSNAVSQGKGPNLASAAVSAIMEAAEQFFAERVSRFNVTTASAKALGVEAALFSRHLLADAPADWPAAETAWVEADDLISGERGWLPLELVHTAYVEPPVPSDGLFVASTTGLACAMSEARAIRHGLLECIERDAIARASVTHGFLHRQRIDQETIGCAELAGLMQLVHDAGLFVAFWAAPAAGGIPVVWCQIMEDGRLPLATPYPADGFAADPDPAAAARRALVEAAQSRLAAISGARDDISRAAFPAYTDWSMIEAHRRLLADGPRPIDFARLEEAAATASATSVGLLERLAGNGITTILLVQLDTEPCPELRAVRVVVPELLPLTEG
jgi:ribosomal protein S12 methylthiotransferase accessory factor